MVGEAGAGPSKPLGGFDTSVRRVSTPLPPPMGSRLAECLPFWESLGIPQLVLDWVRLGHAIPFVHGPPTFTRVKQTPLPAEPAKAQALLEEIQSLLDKGAIERVPPSQVRSGWYGHYFLVSKKTGGWRPILNLKPLNVTIRVDSFKMETLKNVILATQPGEWLASVDLKDAYFHVPIRQLHRKYLRFCVNGKAYQYRVLPFGLSTSPRVFTKVLAPVIAHIRLQGIHVHPYLDDLLIRADSPHLLRQAVQVTLCSLKRAGFLVNFEKSHLFPTQDITYIGGRLCTHLGMVYLPQDRVTAIQCLANQFVEGRRLPARTWMKFLGLMASTIHVLPQARLRMRDIQMFLLTNWSPLSDSLFLRLRVPGHLCPAIQWWALQSNLTQGSQLSPPPHTRVLTTDASGTGWGGVLDGVWTVKGDWVNEDLTLFINNQEMRAVELSLHHFQDQLRGQSVLVRSDNTTTCAYINKQGGTKSWDLCLLAQRLWLWCLQQDIHIRATYIPGKSNTPADALSRGKPLDSLAHPVVDQREWTLSREVAQAVFLALGQPTTDLFATRSNTQCPLFCSLEKGGGSGLKTPCPSGGRAL